MTFYNDKINNVRFKSLDTIQVIMYISAIKTAVMLNLSILDSGCWTWVSDCCLTPNEQFVNYIKAKQVKFDNMVMYILY